MERLEASGQPDADDPNRPLAVPFCCDVRFRLMLWMVRRMSATYELLALTSNLSARQLHAGLPIQEDCMASRQTTITMPEKADVEHVPPVTSQQRRPELGRFLLQVDRQTKGSYQTMEAASKAGIAIKSSHPVVHVSVYDSAESTNTSIQVPV
jgi:hypothetical protein